MVAVAVFSFVVIGVLSANLFGLRMFQLTENKLAANDAARKIIGKVTDDIRNCKTSCIGDVTNGLFVSVADGQPQSGTAVLVNPTTNLADFIIYFLNGPDSTFRRTTSAGTIAILARSITNKVVFRAQDYLGNVLTNNQNNRVIHLDLEFFQPKRQGVVSDYYKMEAAVTRRSLQ
jgi:hypothetical protein